jgi:16S rRNA (adenine1518-N6/adenine1519-N6)-dimethyltransferase
MNIKAKKSLGQNFLKNQRFKDKIYQHTQELYQHYPSLAMIEIGAGLGDLTEGFSQIQPNLTVYEIDEDLIPILQDKFPELTINNQDFMEAIPNLEDALLVSNLPYYIGSRLIVDLIGYNKRVPFAFILQREVAMKTKPSQSLTFFGAILNIFYDTEVALVIPPNAFLPIPKVHSALLIGRPNPNNYDGIKSINILKDMFFKPNKTLYNNLQFGGMNRADVDKIFSHYNLDANTRVNWSNYRIIFEQIYNYI